MLSGARDGRRGSSRGWVRHSLDSVRQARKYQGMLGARSFREPLATLGAATVHPRASGKPIRKLGAAKCCLEQGTSWSFCHRLGAYGAMQINLRFKFRVRLPRPHGSEVAETCMPHTS